MFSWADVISIVKEGRGLTNLILFAGIIYNGYNIQQTNLNVKHLAFGAETNYAMNVVTYGFEQNTKNEDIFEQVREWHDLNNGTYIGALRTICDVQPNRLEELMGSETAKSVCRLARV